MTEALPSNGSLPRPAWLNPITPSGRAVLGALLKAGNLSQADLPRILDIVQPSAARLVGAFKAEGLILASSRQATGRGNPSLSLCLNPDAAFSIGIGLVGDAIQFAILDIAGNVRAADRVSMPDMARGKVVKVLGTLMRKSVASSGIDAGRIIGAGVGFSGFFVGSPERFNPPKPLSDWADVDVAAVVGTALGLSAVADNDGTTAAIAEALLGVGRRSGNFALFHLTNGFGGGLIVDGKPLRGALGNAADFGGAWWLLDQGYPSLGRLLELVRARGTAFETVEDMIRLLKADTPGVQTWIEEAERPFALLGSLIGHIMAPEYIVLGGRLPSWLATKLAARLQLPRTPARNGRSFPLPEVVASEVNGDTAAIGAAAMVMQQTFFD